ncbi:MAG: hypothetical protein WD851_19595 [Pirellulales bacterium]
MTSTMQTPAKATHPGIRVEVPFTLPDPAASRVETHNADADDWQEKVLTLFSQRSELLANAMDATPRETLAALATLDETRRDLETELQVLRWNRMEVIEAIKPAYVTAVADAEVECQRVLGEQLEDFASLGITAASMPAGDANPKAGEHQLRKRAEQELPVMSAKSELEQRKVDLRVLESQRGIAPTASNCIVAWPAPASDVHPAVVRMIGA